MQFDNVLVSPHTAGVTFESRKNIATIAAQQLLDVLDWQAPAAPAQSGSLARIREAI